MAVVMTKEVILILSVLAVLVAYLCVSVSLRHSGEARRQRRADLVREREFRRRWQPTALDVSSISPQIQRLRQDYVAAAHFRPRHADYRRGLAVVRRMIMRMSFFGDARENRLDSTGHETPKHAP